MKWTYPGVVDPGEDVVADGAEEDDGLRRAAAAPRHQLHAHHLPVAHHDVAEHLHTHTHNTSTTANASATLA